MDNFSENIVRAIDERGATPKPRWHFLLKRSVFWACAVLSVAVGGAAFSVAEFVFFDNDSISLISLDQSSIRDIAVSIPYIWLLVLGIFATSAYLGFRHTRKGYRQATTIVVGVVILLSIVLGLTLNAFDFGQSVHKYLLAHTDFYDLLIHSSEDRGDYQGNH